MTFSATETAGGETSFHPFDLETAIEIIREKALEGPGLPTPPAALVESLAGGPRWTLRRRWDSLFPGRNPAEELVDFQKDFLESTWIPPGGFFRRTLLNPKELAVVKALVCLYSLERCHSFEELDAALVRLRQAFMHWAWQVERDQAESIRESRYRGVEKAARINRNRGLKAEIVTLARKLLARETDRCEVLNIVADHFGRSLEYVRLSTWFGPF